MSDPISRAILETLHYADLFNYPLTLDELHRYLIGVRASPPEIGSALRDSHRLNGDVGRGNNFFYIPSHSSNILARQRLHLAAQKQLPRVRFYARLLSYFPFVRMIALTGALAMENAQDNDMDLLIVTTPGRLWFVRGMTVALVRVARLRGDHLCPNFLLGANRLKIADENLYTAHEIVQMIPLYGFQVYRKLRRANAWTESFLPNAVGIADLGDEPHLNPIGMAIKYIFEFVLRGRIGESIETWEMNRKIKKLIAQAPLHADDVEFSRDACRGFFSGHGSRILREFDARLRQLDSVPSNELLKVK